MKKIISIFLCIVMIFTMFTTAAFAGETENFVEDYFSNLGAKVEKITLG